MRRMRRVSTGALLAVLLPAAFASAPRLDTQMSAYGFGVTRGGVTVIVDAGAGHIRVGEKYLPLRVFIAKEDKGNLDVDRTSFTLTDPKGQAHPVATVEEVRREYGPNLIAGDYRYDHHQGDYGYVRLKFSACRFVSPPVFFANPDGPPSVLFERGYVSLNTYTGTFLYFANPAGRDTGVYTLTFTDVGRKVEISVPFTVNWIK